jgi:hypothetical protein
MALPALSSEDQSKLRHVIEEAVKVLNEIKVLREGKTETVRVVAKELDIPLRDMNRAISLAFKKQENSTAIDDEKDLLDTVEEILVVARII